MGVIGCCCECVIGDDDFNRADSSDISTGSALGWTKTRGDAEIVSNKLQFTTPDTILFCNTEPPTPRLRVLVVWVDFSQNGDCFRIYFNAEDEDNWWAIELEAGASGKVRVIKCVAGSEDMKHQWTVNTPHTVVSSIGLCVTSDDQVVFHIEDNNTGGGGRWFYDIDNLEHTGWGIGVPTAFGGTLLVDTISLDGANDAAGTVREDSGALPDCQCRAGVAQCFLNLKYPFILRVVIAGMADGTCGDGSDLNGTYDLELFRSGVDMSGPFDLVEWKITFAPVCVYDTLILQWSGSSFKLYLTHAAATGVIEWADFSVPSDDPTTFCVVPEGDTRTSDVTFHFSAPEFNSTACTAELSIP